MGEEERGAGRDRAARTGRRGRRGGTDKGLYVYRRTRGGWPDAESAGARGRGAGVGGVQREGAVVEIAPAAWR